MKYETSLRTLLFLFCATGLFLFLAFILGYLFAGYQIVILEPSKLKAGLEIALCLALAGLGIERIIKALKGA